MWVPLFISSSSEGLKIQSRMNKMSSENKKFKCHKSK